jgi:cbb3-type cytochrome oxidase maturation protein
MDIIYYLIPLSLILGFLGLLAFIWAIKHGQFEDTETPAHKILTED